MCSSRRFFKAAREWVRANFPGDRLDRVTLTLRDGGRVSLPVPADAARDCEAVPIRNGRARAAPADPPEIKPPNLRAIESAILKAATREPVSTKTLARKAGYRRNSYFLAAVSDLVAARLLVRTVDGIALPGA